MLAQTIFIRAIHSMWPGRRVGRSPRRALAVGLTVFVAAAVGCGWAMERADSFRDPFYGNKESRLRALRKDGGPTFVVIGSSRDES